MDINTSTNELDVLVENNIRLVKWVINHHIKTNESIVGLGFDDLVQEGCIWLIHAARTYDKKRAEFSTYAYTVVRNGLYSYCRTLLSRPEIFISLDDHDSSVARKSMEYDDTENRISAIDVFALLNSVKSSYSGISLRGIEAIELKVKGYTSAEIAELYGVNQNHVAAWISRARQKLKINAQFMYGLGRDL